MIIILVLAILAVVGISALIIGYKKYYMGLMCVGEIVGALAAVGLVICVGVALANNVIAQDIQYQNRLYEKEVLEYRLDEAESTHSTALLYDDIVEFNNHLRSTKKWADNPFTSWMFNQKVADIDYIDYNEAD